MEEQKDNLTDDQLADMVAALGFLKKHDLGMGTYSFPMPHGKAAFLPGEILDKGSLSDALENAALILGLTLSLSFDTNANEYICAVSTGVVSSNKSLNRAKVEACAISLEGKLL